jgi:hypothetical protein
MRRVVLIVGLVIMGLVGLRLLDATLRDALQTPGVTPCDELRPPDEVEACIYTMARTCLTRLGTPEPQALACRLGPTCHGRMCWECIARVQGNPIWLLCDVLTGCRQIDLRTLLQRYEPMSRVP